MESETLTVASWLAGWLSKYAPTSSPYHGQSYSVSDAAWMPAKPPPPWMYSSNAVCWAASSGSPVVERKTTASYCSSVAVVKLAESSVQSTAIPSAPANAQIASRPVSIEPCRKPVVSEYTSTFSSGPSVASSHAAPTAGSSTPCADAEPANSVHAQSAKASDSSPRRAMFSPPEGLPDTEARLYGARPNLVKDRPKATVF